MKTGKTTYMMKRLPILGLILLLVEILSPGWVLAQTINWTKYDNTIPAISDGTSTNGKIPLGTAGNGDDAYTYGASVIKDGSTYKMWYTGHDGTYWRIYYATSSNGLEWTKYDNTIPANADSGEASTNGKVPLGSDGKGDDYYAAIPSVIKDGSTYKMWYGGYDGTASFRIYYATSSNGLEWTKYDNTIPELSDVASTNGKIPLGTAGKGDSTHAIDPQVIKVGGTYKMWYTGYNGAIVCVYHATSPNGLTWTKLDNTIPPVSDTTNSNSRIGLGIAGKGDDVEVRSFAVILVGERDYKMWYSGYDGATYRIYHATYQIPPLAGTVFKITRLSEQQRRLVPIQDERVLPSGGVASRHVVCSHVLWRRRTDCARRPAVSAVMQTPISGGQQNAR